MFESVNLVGYQSNYKENIANIRESYSTEHKVSDCGFFVRNYDSLHK